MLNKSQTLAIFVALTLVVSAVSIALTTDDAQAGKRKYRGTDGGGSGSNGYGTNGADGGGNGSDGTNGGTGQSGTDGSAGTNNNDGADGTSGTGTSGTNNNDGSSGASFP